MQIKQTQLHHTSSGSEESKWERRRGDHAEYATDIKAHNNLNLIAAIAHAVPGAVRGEPHAIVRP
jgi:hypothetical protein